MNHRMTGRRALLSLGLAWAVGTSGSPAAAEWLVFVGGGVQEIQGAWELRGRQLLFHSRGGTFLSVRAEEVDLPASAFLNWQVATRRSAPAAGELAAQPTAPAAATPCAPARVVKVQGAETIELTLGERSETVHLACLDAPETTHKFPQLAWYGQEARKAVEGLLGVGGVAPRMVCLSEMTPPQRDAQGHRIVHLRLNDGRDLGAEVIGRGMGLARPGPCGGGDPYPALEARARAEERGHWGPSGSEVSNLIVSQAMTFSAPPPRQAPSSGG